MRPKDTKKIQLLSEHHSYEQSASVPMVSPIMFKQVEAIVTEQMDSNLAPHLKMMQNKLVEELQASNQHFYQQVWETCRPALRLTDSIYCLIEKP